MENENELQSPAIILNRSTPYSRFKQTDQPQKALSIKSRLHQNIASLPEDEFEWVKSSDKEFEEQINCNCQTLLMSVKTACRNICLSKTFNYLFLVILSIFLVSCLLWDPVMDQSLSKVAEIIELVCNCLFLVIFVIKALEWESQSLLWLLLDFSTSVIGIIAYPLYDANQQVARYLKAYRALKIIFLIKQIKYFHEPAHNLMASLAKIGNLLIPVLFIIYIYAVIGLYTFTDLEYSKCRDPINKGLSENWTVYEESIYLCGIRECPIVDSVQYECLNPIDYGVTPDSAEISNIDQGYGLLHYGNIFYAFLSTIKQTYVTGSSRLIILYKQVISQIYIYFYYYTYIYLISYIYLNIFYSQIITAQMELDEEIKEAAIEQKTGAVVSNEYDKTAIENQPSNKSKSAKNIEKQVKVQDVESVNEEYHESSIINLKTVEPNPPKIATIKLLKDRNYKEQEKNKEQLNYTQKALALGSSPTHSPRINIIVSPRGEENIVDGSLVMKNARVYNVFQDLDKEDDKKLENEAKFKQIQSQKSIELPADASLQTECPSSYRTYQIINNILVVLCCINLSLEFSQQSITFKFVVDCIDFSFFCLFIIELIVKISWERVILKKVQNYTYLDLAIAAICTAGVIYEAVVCEDIDDFFSAGTSTESVLRSFKYLRIILLVLRSTFFTEARLILQSTFRSLYRIKHVVGLWMLIVIIFGIIGFHLHSYKTKINSDNELSDTGTGYQISFDGHFNSIIFTMLTFYNEEWDYLMFEQYLGGGVLVVIWQLLSITIGLVLFSKYFMALLMVELDTLIDQSYQNHEGFGQMLENKEQKDDDEISQKNEGFPNKINDSNRMKSVLIRRSSLGLKKKQSAAKQSAAEEKIDPNQSSCVTLFIKIQYLLRKVIDHLAYKVIFSLMIVAECLVLIALHPHVDRDSSDAEAWLIIDKICKSYFILDLILNLVGFGIWQQESSYFKRSYLNWANVVVIIIEIISFTPLGSNYIFLKIEKIKVVRIGYFVEMQYKRDWNMRMTVLSFMQLLPKVITLLLLTILMYSFFALLLVKIYKNHFYSCSNYYDSGTTITTKWDCYDWGGDWIQMQMNTSNLFNSTLFLFLVATTEGWITLMQPMMNFVGENYEPILDTNKYICIFFVCFFFFGNLIMLNVFVGLSVSNFKRLKQIVTGESKLSKNEKMWLQIKTQIYKLEPVLLERKPENCIRGVAYTISTHIGYKIMQGLIFTSFLVIMSLYHTNMPSDLRKALQYTQYGYVSILMFEYVVEFLAFGIRKDYIKQMIFKNIALFYAIAFIIVQQTTILDPQTSRVMGGIFITLQLSRYLSLLNELTFARKLLNSLMTIFPQTSNIMLMIFVTIFAYAIVGMELFSFLKPSAQLDSFNQNYTSFSSALFALVKFSTMESPINQISDAAQILSPNFICNEINSYEQYLTYGQTGCGSKAQSYIFFLSFHVFYSLLLMSTLMAIIADSYGQVKRQQSAKITKQVLYKVQRAWSRYDPEATGYIPYRQFWMFTAKLLLIYVGKQHQEAAQQEFRQLFASKQDFLKRMSIPIYENQDGVLCFQFNEVIEALTKAYLKDNLGSVKSKKADKMFKERNAASQIGFKKSSFTSSHVATLIVLKSGLKHWRLLALNQGEVFKYKDAMKKFNQVKIS